MNNKPVVGLCDSCLHRGITTWVNPDDEDENEQIYYFFCKKVQRDCGQYMKLEEANRDDYFGYYGDAQRFRTSIVNCSEYSGVATVELTYLNYDPVSLNTYISYEIARGYGLQQIDIYEDGVLLPVYTLASAPDGSASISIPGALSSGNHTYIAILSGGSKSLRMSMEVVVTVSILQVDAFEFAPGIYILTIDYDVDGTDNTDQIDFYITGTVPPIATVAPVSNGSGSSVAVPIALAPGVYNITGVLLANAITSDIYTIEVE